MSSQNIAESIFDSISLIVEKRIANLNYDKTIICTVVNIDDEKNSVYTVSDGSTRFKAQGDGTKYQVDDQVRVLIPEGDFAKEKYIQGRHRADDTTKPITYVSPLGSVLKITDNLLPNASGTYGIIANGDKYEHEIGSVRFAEDYIQSKDIFDTLYLKANFQTNFDQFDMREGDYGLRVKLIAQIKDEQTDEIAYEGYSLDFDSKQHMFGNPYAFKIFTMQEVKYELSQWPENIIGLKLYLYQKGNFKYYDEQTLKSYTPQKIAGQSMYDIRVSNIEIGFGSEVTNAESAKVKIYTTDLETYHSQDSVKDNRILKLLWYNKTENNEYLGFSDGIYDADYDEDAYLEQTALNTRLLQAKSTLYPEDETCLRLAADMHDIDTHSKTAANLIGVEASQILQGFKDYTFGINWSSNPFTLLLSNDEDSSLGALSKKITETNKRLISYYDARLKWAKDTTMTEPVVDNATHQTLLNLLNKDHPSSPIYAVDQLFATVLTTISTQYTSYKSVYDTYSARWNKIRNTLNSIYTQLSDVAETNAATLTTINSRAVKTAYTDLTQTAEFKSLWDNRYCIYWYRYDNTITTIDRHAGKGWERLNGNSKNVIIPEGTTDINIGVPAQNDDNIGYCNAKTSNGLTVTLRTQDEEKFKAILFHNHTKIESNILTFDNLDDVPNSITIDAAGALYIEHANEASKDSYQLYSSTGMLMNSADAQQRRQLRVRFNGETGGDEQLIGATVYWYVPSVVTMLEIFNTDIGTNFDTDRIEIYTTEAEVSDAYDRGRLYPNRTHLVGTKDDGYKFYSINEVFDNYKNHPETYKIYNLNDFASAEKDTDYKYVVKVADRDTLTYELYEYSSSSWVKSGSEFSKFISTAATFNHYVSVDDIPGNADTDKGYVVGPSEGPFEIYKHDGTAWVSTGVKIEDLTLTTINTADYKPGYHCYYKIIGEAEGSTEETPLVKVEDTIFPYHIKDYYQQTATQNSILCIVKKNGLTYEASKHFTFSAFGNSGTDFTLSLTPNPEYPLVTAESSLYVGTTLYDYDNNIIELPADEEGVTYTWVGPSGYTDDLSVQMNDAGNIIGCTVERNSESTCYHGILRCSVKNVEIPFGETKTKLIDLHTDIAIPYGINQNYYIEGASAIVYDSTGANPQYCKKPFILYDKTTNNKVNNITWSLEYYKGDAGDVFTSGKTVVDKKASYTITLDGVTSNASVAQINEYSLNSLPRLTENNILIPSPMYMTYAEEEEQHIYVAAIAKNTEGTVMWAQPILITQNQYGSATMNKWDGGLAIDEENGTILSTMVGAGRKNKDNTFDGVLMGDVGTGSGDNAINTIGLYGFNDGVQSFGFKVDGTAFLGKNGRGRIEFDGNSGTIESAGYKANETGLKIALADGYIDGNNFTLMGRQSKPGTDEDGNPITLTGSTFKLSSDPTSMIEIVYKDLNNADDSGLETLLVGTNNYILRSFNWWNVEGGDEPLTGMEIDIGRGIIQAYYNNDATSNYRLRIDASDSGDSYGEVIDAPLTIGSKVSPNFKVDWDGSITAKAGYVGNWEITENSIKKGVLTLDGTNGTISAVKDSKTTFKVDGSTGLMTAEAITVKTSAYFTNNCVVRVNTSTVGKVYPKYGSTVTTIPEDATLEDCEINMRGSIYMPGTPTMIGNYKWALNWQIPKSLIPESELSGASLGFYANGLWVFGERFSVDSDVFTIGNTAPCRVSLIKGSSMSFNDGSTVYFYSPETIWVDGTYNLASYIASIGSGTNPTTSIAYAGTASKIGASTSSLTTLGNASQPVYLSGGEFKVCNTYPNLSSYATQSWVEGKGYLTSSSLSGYATQSWVNNKGYLTSSSLSGYATTAQLNEQIALLQEQINALKPTE